MVMVRVRFRVRGRDLDLRAQCIGLQRQGQRTQRGLQLLEGLLAHVAVEAVYDVRGGRDVVHVERVDHLVRVRARARARGRVRRARVTCYLPGRESD